jgi:hypothetical protein
MHGAFARGSTGPVIADVIPEILSHQIYKAALV